MHGSVGMRTVGECIRGNMTGPFLLDTSEMFARETALVASRIFAPRKAPVVDAALRRFVLDYLQANGYEQTARAVAGKPVKTVDAASLHYTRTDQDEDED